MSIILLAIWGALNAASTVGNYVPAIASCLNHLQINWPWYVWIIGFLALGMIAVFEGGYRQVQALRKMYDPVTQSTSLATLPVWRQDVQMAVCKICRGIDLALDASTFFAFVKIISTVDVSVLSIDARALMSYGMFDCTPIKDLSEWLLEWEIIDDRQRQNTNVASLQNFSLWRSLEDGGLRAGIYKQGWVGFTFPRDSDVPHLEVQDFRALKIAIEDGRHVIYRHRYDAWQQTSDKVINAAFRNSS